MRLTLMPAEILVHIASYLRPNDAFALSRGSRAIFDALRRDVVDPLRLGGRIRWVHSVTGMRAAIRDVLAAPAARRRTLIDALYQRAQALHPQLQEPSGQLLAPHREAPALAKPWWDALYAPTDPARARLGQPDGHGELLARVLTSPPRTRVRQLLSWFGTSGMAPPPVSEWGRIVSALPTECRGQVLVRMANDIPEDEYDQAQAIVLAAVQESTSSEGPVPADHADVLQKLAWRLVWGAGSVDVAQLAQSWDTIFSLARRLPLQSQPAVLAQLTEFVHREDADAAAVAQLHPRWPPFIRYVCEQLPGADIVMILGTLAEHNCDADDDDLEQPIRDALREAAAGLHGEWRAALLARLVRYWPSELPEPAAMWDEAFHSSAYVPLTDPVALYCDLAKGVEQLPDVVQDACWLALAQRVETAVDAGARLPVLLALAGHVLDPIRPERGAVLARIGAQLPVEDRAQLSAAMIHGMRSRTPRMWHMQISQLEELLRQAQLAPARTLAGLLFRYPAGGAFDLTADELTPDPGALLCARMPRTPEEALDALSEILTMLPLAHRGTVLLTLSPMCGHDSQQPMPWSLLHARWLLNEALKLKPLQHHGIGVVANVLRVVAQRCLSAADARSLLPLLEDAVHALPADARASPWLMLGSLIQRLLPDDTPARDRWIAGISTLPVEDAAIIRGNDSRKRKEAPE